jgi:hypothetical protein
MPKAFRSGDIVRIIQSGGSLGPTRYVYSRTDKNPNYCWIREAGTVDGKRYADQRWMPSMLKHCPDEARLDQRVRDITSGKIKEGPALLGRLFSRR